MEARRGALPRVRPCDKPRGRLLGIDGRTFDDLRTRYGLFTVRRTGLEQGDCVRVTPALYNGPADVDRLAAALKQLSLERG